MGSERYIEKYVKQDLNEKMVIVAGPRQVGKTSFAIEITDLSSYLNWDVPADREVILKQA